MSAPPVCTWAFGGRWLPDTVGGACLPLVVPRSRYARFRRVIRAMSWVGGGFLVVHGALYALVSVAVLHGVVSVSDLANRRAAARERHRRVSEFLSRVVQGSVGCTAW